MILRSLASLGLAALILIALALVALIVGVAWAWQAMRRTWRRSRVRRMVDEERTQRERFERILRASVKR